MACNKGKACYGPERTFESEDNTAIDHCLKAWTSGIRPLVVRMVSTCYNSDGQIADTVSITDVDSLFDDEESCEEYVTSVCPLQAWGTVPMTDVSLSYSANTQNNHSEWCDSITSVRVACDAQYHMQATTTPIVTVKASIDMSMYADGRIEQHRQPALTVFEQQ